VLVGLIVSATMIALLALLFRGPIPRMKGVTNAGVLELAWLFAHSPETHQSLVNVKVPTVDSLRKAGEEIVWKGALEEDWEKSRNDRDEDTDP
jgi:hypothetical protein